MNNENSDLNNENNIIYEDENEDIIYEEVESNSNDDETLKTFDNEFSNNIINNFNFHKDPVVSLSIDPLGNHFISGSCDDHIALWDINKSEILFSRKLTDTINFCDYSKDGKYFAFSDLKSNLYIYLNNDKFEEKYYFEKIFDDEISSFNFHPKGNALLLSSLDGTVSLYNVNNGKLINNFYGHSNIVNNANFIDNGKQIASISEDLSLKIWSPLTGNLNLNIFNKHTFHNENIISFDYIDDLILTGDNDGYLCTSNYKNGNIFSKIQLTKEENNNSLEILLIAKKLNYLSYINLNGEFGLFDIKTNKKFFKIKEAENWNKLVYMEKYNYFFYSSTNGELSLLKLGEKDSQKFKISNEAIHDIKILNDNQLLISGEDCIIKLFDIRKS